MSGSRILDPGRWRSGQDGIDWARSAMPVTALLGAQAGPSLAGLRVLLSLVLEPKTAVLALTLAEAGADVTVHCGAWSTRDDVAAALHRAGLRVIASSAATSPAQVREQALAALDSRPQLLADDGASLTRLLHTARPALLADVVGATEETTSGVRPLRVMESEGALRIPVIAVNDARSKTLFDNGHGTGQTSVFTALDVLAAPIDGAHVVVVGYGRVGRGVARHAAALGARVTVAEVDPVAALEATFDGYPVAPLLSAAVDADLVVSATGIAHTIDVPHLLALPVGAAVSVAGGVRQEIATASFAAAGAVRREVADRVQAWRRPDGTEVLVLDDGACLNCTAGEGNPVQVMDLSWGVQLLALDHLVRSRGDLGAGVHALAAELDAQVAATALAARGIGLDSPSHQQVAYLAAWRQPSAEPVEELR